MKQQFTLENGIPLKKRVRGRKTKYPFSTMRVGNSFITGGYSPEDMRRVINAAKNWAKINGKSAWKFSARKTKDEQIRVWRVK